MARVKKIWSAQTVDKPQVESTQGLIESPVSILSDSTEGVTEALLLTQEAAPELSGVVHMPEPPPVPAHVPASKSAIAKTYVVGDEYALDGKRGKVIVIFKDMIKVRWADGSVGLIKK